MAVNIHIVKQKQLTILITTVVTDYLGMVVLELIWALTVSWLRSNTAKTNGTAELYLPLCILKL